MFSSVSAKLLALLATSASPAGEALPPPAQPLADGEFESLWYDGQAELNGYRWKGSRYGQMRSGEAVAIFVTETLRAGEHVKVDRPAEHRGETLTALKLNLVRDFQTGLYDYNTMASIFARVEDFRALKSSFSSAEWCGHVYEELDVGAQGVALDVRSWGPGRAPPHLCEHNVVVSRTRARSAGHDPALAAALEWIAHETRR